MHIFICLLNLVILNNCTNPCGQTRCNYLSLDLEYISVSVYSLVALIPMGYLPWLSNYLSTLIIHTIASLIRIEFEIHCHISNEPNLNLSGDVLRMNVKNLCLWFSLNSHSLID